MSTILDVLADDLLARVQESARPTEPPNPARPPRGPTTPTPSPKGPNPNAPPRPSGPKRQARVRVFRMLPGRVRPGDIILHKRDNGRVDRHVVHNIVPPGVGFGCSKGGWHFDNICYAASIKLAVIPKPLEEGVPA